jgi:hypothetical protein
MNAQNRLVSELSKFLILTNSLGWTLKHEGLQLKAKRFCEKNKIIARL